MWLLRECAACRTQTLSATEASTLPAVLRGLSVDVTSMDKAGCASLIAISAAALADLGQEAPQVFILGSSADSLQPIRNRLGAVSKEIKLTTFDTLSGHICMGTATEALMSWGMKGAIFVVVAGADELSTELSSVQGDMAENVARLIDTAATKRRPQMLLVGTERAEKRNPKVKGLTAKLMGSCGHVEITMGKDLFDFMGSARLGVSAVLLSSLGASLLVLSLHARV